MVSGLDYFVDKETMKSITYNADAVLFFTDGRIRIVKNRFDNRIYDTKISRKHNRTALFQSVELISTMITEHIYGKDGPRMFKDPFQKELYIKMKEVIQKHHPK